MTTDFLLDLRDISVTFGGVLVLDRVTMAVCAGEAVGLIGANGAGKSTTINAIAGLVRPSAGGVLFDGVNLKRKMPSARSRMGIGRTYQNLSLFDQMSVSENIQVGIDHLRSEVMPRGRRAQRAFCQETLHRILGTFGLYDVAERCPSTLPYGTRKLVELARCLAASPHLIILDEPMAGLNTEEKSELASTIKSVVSEWKPALLLVEHDMASVEALCDRVYVLDRGRVLMDGTFSEVTSDTRVVEAYLGKGQEPSAI